MKIDDDFCIELESNIEKIYDNICFITNILTHLDDEKKKDYAKQYAKKINNYGVCFSAYLDDEIVGSIIGYANDSENKKAYISGIAIKEDIGIMRGIVWHRLVRSFLLYAKEKDMNMIRAEVSRDNNHAKEQYLLLGMEVVEITEKGTEMIEISLENALKNFK